MGPHDLSVGGCHAPQARTRDIDRIDSELRALADVRGATQELGELLPSIDMADELLDERLRATRARYNAREFLLSPSEQSA